MGPKYTFNGEPLSLLSFVESNLHDEELPYWLADMAKLGVGDELRLGGGAFATTIIRRVA